MSTVDRIAAIANGGSPCRATKPPFSFLTCVGDIGATATSLSKGLLSQTQLDELYHAGCVCDMLCNFLDAQGRSVAHPLNERVMSISPETIARAAHVVIATGGAARAEAILAARQRVGCNTLLTDEPAARRLLELTD